MSRILLASTASAFALLAASPALAQTIDFDGANVIVDQLTPPGGVSWSTMTLLPSKSIVWASAGLAAANAMADAVR